MLKWWARLGLNQRPLACEASALPLSYAPDPKSGSGCLRGGAGGVKVGRGRPNRSGRPANPVSNPRQAAATNINWSYVSQNFGSNDHDRPC